MESELLAQEASKKWMELSNRKFATQQEARVDSHGEYFFSFIAQKVFNELGRQIRKQRKSTEITAGPIAQRSEEFFREEIVQIARQAVRLRRWPCPCHRGQRQNGRPTVAIGNKRVALITENGCGFVISHRKGLLAEFVDMSVEDISCRDPIGSTSGREKNSQVGLGNQLLHEPLRFV